MKIKTWSNLIVVIVLMNNLGGYLRVKQIAVLEASTNTARQSAPEGNSLPWGDEEARSTFQAAGVKVDKIGHIGGMASAVAVAGEYAYLVEGPSLVILDISAPNAPSAVGRWSELLPNFEPGVAVAGDHAYVADAESGLRVIDVSDVTNPIEVGFYDTHGSAFEVALSGDYAYVADGTFGLWVIDVSNPTNPTEFGFYNTSGSAMGVALAGSYAYVADGIGGLRVIDVSDPANPSEVGDTPGCFKSIAVAGHYAYCDGLQVFDVSDPTSPTAVGSTYVQEATDVDVIGNYAYVTDAGNWMGEDSGLRVINISNPTSPYEVGFYETPGTAWGVAIAGSHAYVADGWNGGLGVISVTDPNNPSEVSFYHAPGNAWSVAVEGDHAYVIDGGNGNLLVVDVSDPANPIGVGVTSIPKSGSVTVESYRLAVSDTYAYVAAGSDGLRVIDVSDPTNPIEVGFTDTWGVPYDVAIASDFAYVADGSAGLTVVDVSDPANPSQVGWYDTPGDANDVAVAGSYAYVADGSGGLRVIDVAFPTDPIEVGNNSGCYKYIAVAQSYAYCDGLMINDISNPTNPSKVSYYDIPSNSAAQSVAVVGSYAYVSNGGDGFWVINVHDPLNPNEAGFFNTQGAAYDVAVTGNYAFVADGGHGLTILHLTEFKDVTQSSITSDAPDPSRVGEPFFVAFEVAADNGFPGGSVTVTVTGETASCSGTLTGGTGNCMITLNNQGAFTLTATYAGDNFFLPSSDTESHLVLVTKQIFLPLAIRN